MKKILLIISCLSLSWLVTSHAFAAAKIISCPSLTAGSYGKTNYYDRKTGRNWDLTWSQKATPVWDSISIPQMSVCGKGKGPGGVPVSFQCVLLQCKSPAVVAMMGQGGSLKCYSAYTSTANTFYCDDFTS